MKHRVDGVHKPDHNLLMNDIYVILKYRHYKTIAKTITKTIDIDRLNFLDNIKRYVEYSIILIMYLLCIQ